MAAFVILIASINFMNLATARNTQRAREIGVRKALGSTRSALARRFLGESVLIAAMAFLLAVIIVILLLPAFNQLTNKAIHVSLIDPLLWLQFGGLALLTGLLAGSYPALYLSSFSVINVLRGASKTKSQGSGLRKGLVVFQFVMSIVLMIGTLTVYRQLNYIRNKSLGLDRENVVYIASEGKVRDQFDAFKQELLRKQGILNVARANHNPLELSNNTINVNWNGKIEGDNTLYSTISSDYDFIETLKIELKEGRLFSQEYGADSNNYIINEKAAEAMGMTHPIGQRLNLWGKEGLIIGLVKNFHMQSLYRPIDPVIIQIDPQSANLIFIRIQAGQTKEALAELESAYNRFNPEYPFNCCFLDDEFEQTYRSEIVIGTLANIFAVLAVLIACLGLLGLAAFTAEQRRKEIAIRKVLGSSVLNVVLLISREFILLVVGAYAVALPIGYLLMTRWLKDFTFHTTMSLGIVIGAGVIAVVIAWLNVSYQSIRAATTNPVVSLRSE